MNTVLEQRRQRVPFAVACRALSLNRDSVYARSKRADNPQPPRRCRAHAVQPRALSAQERQRVIAIMQSAEYGDQPPAQFYQNLLEKQQYHCSIRTMHRILHSQKQNADRRDQRPAQHHVQPRLLARRPNEVWTWDITNCH